MGRIAIAITTREKPTQMGIQRFYGLGISRQHLKVAALSFLAGIEPDALKWQDLQKASSR
jgi:hypothetical protein